MWGKGCGSNIPAEAGETYLHSLSSPRLAQCTLCYEEILTSLGFCQLETGVLLALCQAVVNNKSDSP